MNEPKEYYSTDEVAALLGLHVRTIRRFIREGKLRATRVGKQFRIAESDLSKLVGSDGETKPARSQNRRRHIVALTTVDIDAVGPAERERLVNLLGGAFKSLDNEQTSRRFDAIYYEEERRLRLLINADLDVTTAVLGMIRVVLEEMENG
ncbi:helix-turn-helix domain-containing protein [Aggregatilinea lenta]|jgi:excisionase family DNA binding protein|uniref:helix-turn-helix domain-containing protein n=1 Tax=Aggregatilinea lenta TaxID=913108 RepID=UPI000E5A77EB|nr:helix-turn-helix domain-containing protein [Aggregatilinea lenta]